MSPQEPDNTAEAPAPLYAPYALVKDAGSKAWQQRIRGRAKSLADQLEMGYLELGEILYRIYDASADGDPKNGSVLARWGYESVGDYAEKELGLYRRKSQLLVRVFYRVEVELDGLGRGALYERFTRLGWSKARELIAILTKENAEEWITRCETWNYATTVERVRLEKERRRDELVRRELEKQPDPVAASNTLAADLPATVPMHVEQEEDLRWVSRTFRMEASQSESLSLALKRAQDLAGNIKKPPSSLLALVCIDFLSGADWRGGDLDSKLRFVAKVEKSLGLRLVVVDDSDSVVYGMRALESAARRMQEDAAGAAPEEAP